MTKFRPMIAEKLLHNDDASPPEGAQTLPTTGLRFQLDPVCA
jgi:hypothetical protein